MSTAAKLSLEKLYTDHHKRGERYGYLFCSGARGVFLKEWIGRGKKVLDLGCRDGELTKFYVEGNEVLGVDIDRAALKLAEKKLALETRWLDLNGDFPFAPESADVVVACEIMEHIFYTQPFLEKIFSTLKRGGLFVGSVPNAFRFRNRMKFLFGKEYENDPTHMHQFSCSGLEHALKAARFSSIQIYPLGGKVLPFLAVSQRMPRGINRLFAKDLLWRADKPA